MISLREKMNVRNEMRSGKMIIVGLAVNGPRISGESFYFYLSYVPWSVPKILYGLWVSSNKSNTVDGGRAG